MNRQTELNGILSPFLQKIRMAKALPYIRGKCILDVGSCRGEILKYLKRDIDYIGIEGNSLSCEFAQKKYPQHIFMNLYLDIYNSANFDISKRDTIIMLSVFEHLSEPLEILRNLRRYLAKDGNIVITTPSNYAEWILKAGGKFRIFANDKHEHKNHFSKAKLISICEEAGASIVHYSSFEFGANHLVVLK